MKNSEVVAKLEAALALLHEVEEAMDARTDLDDLATKMSNDVCPVIGMMIDEVHYNRPDPSDMRMGM
jgi:hypothetical protein